MCGPGVSRVEIEDTRHRTIGYDTVIRGEVAVTDHFRRQDGRESSGGDAGRGSGAGIVPNGPSVSTLSDCFKVFRETGV